MKNLNIKKLIPLIIGVVCIAGIAIFAGRKKPEDPVITEATGSSSETEWAVYWYLCGSNLESGSQSASLDLKEMLSVSIPENVKVIIEAGGSREWNTKGIDPEKITRLIYTGNKMKTLEVLPMANMGETETLRDFLSWCVKEHPAKHSMVILWDHGGGSLYGVSYDQNYNMDCLTYTELKEALSLAEGKKFDIIGFDACLMSSVDTISSCMGAADYMIASEQLEPVCGWDYASVMKAFENPGELTAENLGKAVCDGYMSGCEREGLSESATLCLCDLTKAEPLLKAYNDKLLDRFDHVLISDETAATFRRCAVDAENYGANGKSVGYTDMIDLLGFMGTDGKIIDYPFEELVNDAVVYQVRGDAYNRGCGISCYYPLDASLRSVLQYTAAVAPHEDVSLFYRYMINPDISDTVSGYAERRSIDENEILKNHFRTSTLSLIESSLKASDDGTLSLKLDENVARNLSQVNLKITGVYEVKNTLFYDVDTMYFWMEEGEYPAKSSDFETGAFTFDGTGKRVAIDGVQFATFVVSDTDERTVLYSPAVIDDHDGILFFTVSKSDGKVTFLGAYTGKTHTTGLFTMESVFNKDEEDEQIDAERYDNEAADERTAFDYTFTFDELYEYHEKFGYIGEPYEMEEYFHGNEEKEEDDNVSSDVTAFAFERLSPLNSGQIITPVYSCIYTKKLEAPTKETAFFKNWETTESITYSQGSKLTFETGYYTSDYKRMNLYSYTLSDAWGNNAESDPLLIP